MKPAVMFRDITLSLFRRPITERYPFERRTPPMRLRGQLQWDPAACTGCGLCATDCPANAIQMLVLDKKAKQFVLEYHVDRCTFCAECVHSCRQGCLTMSPDAWELAALSRTDFVLRFSTDPQQQERKKHDITNHT